MNLLEGVSIPIIQAPMVGAAGVDMVVAVCEAGGLGTLGAAGLTADEIAASAAESRARTSAPFALNLLITRSAPPKPEQVAEALERLRPWYERAGAPVPDLPNCFAPDFEAQFRAVVAAAPAVASFAFDILTLDEVNALHAAGSCVVGTANTVAEAKAWAAVGADAVCAQGGEAGGHRGAFLAPPEDSLIGTLPLVVACRAAVDIPVIAAGGIMDGRGVAAALALGAVAAQMGTAFLLADQSTANAAWQKAIREAGDDSTRLTRAFSGRYARGIENDFMRQMRAVEGEVPAYPVQNRLTLALRAAAAARGDPSMLSLWAGQGVKLARGGDAGQMVRAWWAQAREASSDLASRVR